MKLNLTTAVIVLGIVVVTLRFRNEISSALNRIPIVGQLANQG